VQSARSTQGRPEDDLRLAAERAKLAAEEAKRQRKAEAAQSLTDRLWEEYVPDHAKEKWVEKQRKEQEREQEKERERYWAKHGQNHIQSGGAVSPPEALLAKEPSGSMARLRRAFSSQTGVPTTSGNGKGNSVAIGSSEGPGATMSPTIKTSPTTSGTGTGSGAGAGNVDASREGLAADQMPTIKFIPHQDIRSNKPSLAFGASSRTLPHEDCVIRVGRYSERDMFHPPPAGMPSAAPVGFKSKVVSRKHCEFWCSKGQWYIRDVKSSSGTFLNHIRLSQPNTESKPFPINDGDVVQLGIDFKGGEEAIFRCVKIRVECNRSWQKKLNEYK